MQINLERPDQNSIQSYSNNKVVIDDKTYQTSIIVSSKTVESDWQIEDIQKMTEQDVEKIMQHAPEIVIVGHQKLGQFPDDSVRFLFANQGVGFECMDIGAACRTFNVLLSEFRNVVLALIIPGA